LPQTENFYFGSRFGRWYHDFLAGACSKNQIATNAMAAACSRLQWHQRSVIANRLTPYLFQKYISQLERIDSELECLKGTGQKRQMSGRL
jgi:hypothetical protein